MGRTSGLSMLKDTFPEEGTDQRALYPTQFKTNALYIRAVNHLRPMIARNNYCDYLNLADKDPEFMPYPTVIEDTRNTTNIIGIIHTVTIPNSLS